jgi:hypothetical protein
MSAREFLLSEEAGALDSEGLKLVLQGLVDDQVVDAVCLQFGDQQGACKVLADLVAEDAIMLEGSNHIRRVGKKSQSSSSKNTAPQPSDMTALTAQALEAVSGSDKAAAGGKNEPARIVATRENETTNGSVDDEVSNFLANLSSPADAEVVPPAGRGFLPSPQAPPGMAYPRTAQLHGAMQTLAVKACSKPAFEAVLRQKMRGRDLSAFAFIESTHPLHPYYLLLKDAAQHDQLSAISSTPPVVAPQKVPTGDTAQKIDTDLDTIHALLGISN